AAGAVASRGRAHKGGGVLCSKAGRRFVSRLEWTRRASARAPELFFDGGEQFFRFLFVDVEVPFSSDSKPRRFHHGEPREQFRGLDRNQLFQQQVGLPGRGG